MLSDVVSGFRGPEVRFHVLLYFETETLISDNKMTLSGRTEGGFDVLLYFLTATLIIYHKLACFVVYNRRTALLV